MDHFLALPLVVSNKASSVEAIPLVDLDPHASVKRGPNPRTEYSTIVDLREVKRRWKKLKRNDAPYQIDIANFC